MCDLWELSNMPNTHSITLPLKFEFEVIIERNNVEDNGKQPAKGFYRSFKIWELDGQRLKLK